MLLLLMFFIQSWFKMHFLNNIYCSTQNISEKDYKYFQAQELFLNIMVHKKLLPNFAKNRQL